MSEVDAELLELVKGLTARIESLEVEIKSLRVLTQDVPEETMVAIAAGVAGYLGLRASRRQVRFQPSRNWQVTTRRSQHVHAPLHLR